MRNVVGIELLLFVLCLNLLTNCLLCICGYCYKFGKNVSCGEVVFCSEVLNVFVRDIETR